MGNRIFVAPHFDDVALSCGATVATYARDESPVVVTVFAKGPDAERNLGSFARLQHRQWELADHLVIAQRLAEDACANCALGKTVCGTHLQFEDAIYRNLYYRSDEQLFGEVPEFDQHLIDDIAAELATVDGNEFFVPLAIGNHVDHQIVFQAGKKLSDLGAIVFGYEDLPYALTTSYSGMSVPSEAAEIVELNVEAFNRKWTAISCYKSQLPVIFRDIDTPRLQLEQHARTVGDGALAERFWKI